MRVIKDIEYSETRQPQQTLDVYLPETQKFSTLIYMHGGGLETGDKEEPRNVFCFLAKNNIAVVTINYRMYPNASYPEFIKDAAAAVSWTYKNMNQYGQCDSFFVGGTSAGAYLAMMLCFDTKYLGIHGIHPDQLAGFVFDGGQPTVHLNVLKERGMDTRRVIVDEAAPLYHVTHRPDIAPMHILLAEQDMQNRYEQTMLLISTMKHFDIPDSKITLKIIENSSHSQYCGQVDKEGKNIFGEIFLDFINKVKSDC